MITESRFMYNNLKKTFTAKTKLFYYKKLLIKKRIYLKQSPFNYYFSVNIFLSDVCELQNFSIPFFLVRYSIAKILKCYSSVIWTFCFTNLYIYAVIWSKNPLSSQLHWCVFFSSNMCIHVSLTIGNILIVKFWAQNVEIEPI